MGMVRVEVPVICVLTRFGLHSAWSLIPLLRSVRRIQRESAQIKGLLKSALLIENLHTCYTLSLWTDERALLEFGSVQSHVNAVRGAFKRTWRKEAARPEIWSAQLSIVGLSWSSHFWHGLDFRALLGKEWHRIEDAKQRSRELLRTVSSGGI